MGIFDLRSAQTIDFPARSQFVKVKNCKGVFVSIKKSSYVRLLSSGGYSLSSDRALRVRGQCAFLSSQSDDLAEDVEELPAAKKAIHVGDWCVVKHCNPAEDPLVARIVSFASINAKTGVFRPSSILRAEVSNRSLGYSANFYTLSSRGRLTLFRRDDYNFNETYIGTVPRRARDGDGLFFTRDIRRSIQCFIVDSRVSARKYFCFKCA